MATAQIDRAGNGILTIESIALMDPTYPRDRIDLITLYQGLYAEYCKLSGQPPTPAVEQEMARIFGLMQKIKEVLSSVMSG